ncbi:6-hydroxymethylpterin diphosphokinase MptE-like protein, partial [Spirochaetota bacterium]
ISRSAKRHIFKNIFLFSASFDFNDLAGENDAVYVVENPNYIRNFSSEAALFKERLLACMNDRVKEKTTNAYFDAIWSYNLLHNTLHERHVFMLHELKNTIGKQNKALFISSGLSIENKPDRLKELSTSLITFSVPGILPFLLHHGVQVDFIISTDGGFSNYRHFGAIMSMRHQLPIIAPFSVHYKIPREFHRTVFFFQDSSSELEVISYMRSDPEAADVYTDADFIPMSGSSVNTGIRIIQKLGMDNIITAGIDFAITPFKAHALSNTSEEILFNTTERLHTFEGAYAYFTPVKHTLTQGLFRDEKLELYNTLFDQIVHDHKITCTQYEKAGKVAAKKNIPCIDYTSHSQSKGIVQKAVMKQMKKQLAGAEKDYHSLSYDDIVNAGLPALRDLNARRKLLNSKALYS